MVYDEVQITLFSPVERMLLSTCMQTAVSLTVTRRVNEPGLISMTTISAQSIDLQRICMGAKQLSDVCKSQRGHEHRKHHIHESKDQAARWEDRESRVPGIWVLPELHYRQKLD